MKPFSSCFVTFKNKYFHQSRNQTEKHQMEWSAKKKKNTINSTTKQTKANRTSRIRTRICILSWLFSYDTCSFVSTDSNRFVRAAFREQNRSNGDDNMFFSNYSMNQVHESNLLSFSHFILDFPSTQQIRRDHHHVFFTLISFSFVHRFIRFDGIIFQ